VPGWSSFDREIASHCGSRHHGVTVRTCRLSSLIREHGLPLYCKIDVEGSERMCVDQLDRDTRPPFLSAELPTNGAAPREIATGLLMDRLEMLGYDRFKVISQVTFQQPGPLLPAIKAMLPGRCSVWLTHLAGSMRKHRGDGSWAFRGTSSGPFGEATQGSWLTAREARRLIAVIQRNDDISEWYDVHAAVSDFA